MGKSSYLGAQDLPLLKTHLSAWKPKFMTHERTLGPLYPPVFIAIQATPLLIWKGNSLSMEAGSVTGDILSNLLGF
jgi:hypothetical protein